MVVVGGDQDLVAGPVLPGLLAVAGGDGVRSEPAGLEQPVPGGVVELGDVDLADGEHHHPLAGRRDRLAGPCAGRRCRGRR